MRVLSSTREDVHHLHTIIHKAGAKLHTTVACIDEVDQPRLHTTAPVRAQLIRMSGPSMMVQDDDSSGSSSALRPAQWRQLLFARALFVALAVLVIAVWLRAAPSLWALGGTLWRSCRRVTPGEEGSSRRRQKHGFAWGSNMRRVE